jgi:hypothetical protein
LPLCRLEKDGAFHRAKEELSDLINTMAAAGALSTGETAQHLQFLRAGQAILGAPLPVERTLLETLLVKPLTAIVESGTNARDAIRLANKTLNWLRKVMSK